MELEKLKYFFKIEVSYSKQGIFISQRNYILNLLKETGKLRSKTSQVPIEENHKIRCEESPTIEKLVRKLIYLSHTRPDISYVVSVASPRKGLLFRKEGTLSMEIYTYVYYAGLVMDRRSAYGYCMFLGGNLVTWRSKKQNMVSQSSAKAEFRAMAHGICEGL
ncbi:putative mitochondrial protein, partial [Mucuna pruriens]